MISEFCARIGSLGAVELGELRVFCRLIRPLMFTALWIAGAIFVTDVGKGTITADPNGVNGFAFYTFDKVGNRLQRNSEISGLPSRTEAVNSVTDRLLANTSDENGNTTGEAQGTDSYESLDRLTHRSGTDGPRDRHPLQRQWEQGSGGGQALT